MSRSLLHDWECDIYKCCREDNVTGMIDIAEDIYNTAYARGKNYSDIIAVLDKVRTEIEEAQTYDGIYIDRAYVLEILDKYKVESEK